MKIFSILFLFLLTIKSNAQNDVILLSYKVYYDYQKPLSRDVFMVLDNTKSLYIEKANSTTFLGKDKEFIIRDHKEDERLLTDISNFVIKAEHKYEDKFLVQNLATNKLLETVQDPYFGNFISEETLTVIDWNLENEFKTINNVKCQKAIGIFRGLQWEIWFSTKYPIPFGPWKLFGAPGLIFEASTVDKKVSYLLEEIKSGNLIIDDNLPNYKKNEITRFNKIYGCKFRCDKRFQ